MSFVTPSARSGPRWRPILLVAISLLLFVIFGGLFGVYWFAHNGIAADAVELPYDQFNRKLENGQIYKDDKHPLDLLIEEGSSLQTLRGFYSDQLPAKDHLDRLHPFQTTVLVDYDRNLKEQLKRRNLTPTIRNNSKMLAATLLNFLPIIIFLLIVVAVLGLIIWAVVQLVAASRRPLIPPAPR